MGVGGVGGIGRVWVMGGGLTFRGLGTERARLGTFRGFGTERARLGTFKKNLKKLSFFTQKEQKPPQNLKLSIKFKKSPYLLWFWFFFFWTPNFTKLLNP